jgi:hypothetical protein
MAEGGNDFDDFAWVPKREMNKYLTKSFYENFVPILKDV